MTNSTVLVSAARTDRSLVRASSTRPTLKADPPLLLWRRLINHAFAEAKKTTNEGLPTDLAILARWWISDCRPPQSDKENWERCFECACHWLDIDAATYRKRLIREIEAALKQAWLQVWFRLVYLRRAMVLSCAGQPTAIARQFMLPLACPATYDEVAGIDKPDMFAEMDRA